MTKKKYELTGEHRKMLPVCRDKWIANAMSTKQIDQHDKDQMIIAVEGMYRSAGLTPPPRNRIVFVESPFVMRFAGGFAAAIWHMRKNNKSIDATRAATTDATTDATYAATHAASSDATTYATSTATRAATSTATRAATTDATTDATYAATHAATSDATTYATSDATRDATTDATIDATYNATRAAARAATTDATIDATYNATRAAARAATSDATYDATSTATRAATRAAASTATTYATRAATTDATYAATYTATYAATTDATYDATSTATSTATRAAASTAAKAVTYGERWYNLDVQQMILLAKDLFGGNYKFAIQCTSEAWRMEQGGNQWSYWDSFITFFRDIAKLPVDYSKYSYWEIGSLHGGRRIMHEEFCIISDRPEVLLVDDQNRPHCENGPFCKWRDGTAMYAWHGVYVPEKWIMDKSTITPEIALKHENVELRRAACEIVGWDRILSELDAKTLDKDEDPEIGELVEVTIPDIGKEKFIRVTCGTGRRFAIPVPPETKTALEGNAWTYDIPTDLLKMKEFRT